MNASWMAQMHRFVCAILPLTPILSNKEVSYTKFWIERGTSKTKKQSQHISTMSKGCLQRLEALCFIGPLAPSVFKIPLRSYNTAIVPVPSRHRFTKPFKSFQVHCLHNSIAPDQTSTDVPLSILCQSYYSHT